MVAGVVLLAVALALLSEYRRLFRENPRAVMSVEMLMRVLLNSGGPGYMACVVLLCACMFLLGAALALVQGQLAAFRL